MLEQVAQVLAREQAHPARARPGDRELEIGEPGRTVREHQPVRFLGEVVVGDAGAVQALQQAVRVAEPGRVAARRALVHGRAVEVAAIEHASVPAQQLWQRRQSVHAP